MTDPIAIRVFALAGNALLTLQSRRTERHFTYRIRRAKPSEDQPNLRFVSVLAFRDFYHYLGILRPIGDTFEFVLTKKSEVTADMPSYRGFAFFWRHIDAGKLPPDMTIRHEGRCCRCGRPLTHPDSIDSGIGPECALKAD